MSEPVHSGEYLAEKLLEVINNFRVTKTVFTIIRDNASANTVLLRHFEDKASEGEDLLHLPWPF